MVTAAHCNAYAAAPLQAANSNLTGTGLAVSPISWCFSRYSTACYVQRTGRVCGASAVRPPSGWMTRSFPPSSLGHSTSDLHRNTCLVRRRVRPYVSRRKRRTCFYLPSRTPNKGLDLSVVQLLACLGEGVLRHDDPRELLGKVEKGNGASTRSPTFWNAALLPLKVAFFKYVHANLGCQPGGGPRNANELFGTFSLEATARCRREIGHR